MVNKFRLMNSQSAIEYLLIFGVVMVVALVAISVFGNVNPVGDKINIEQQKLKLRSGSVGVQNYEFKDSYCLIEVRNNHYNKMVIESIKFADNSSLVCDEYGTNWTLPLNLDVGQDFILNCNSVNKSNYLLDTAREVPDICVVWTDLHTGAQYYSGNSGECSHVSEVCDNGIDDNNNSLVDCADSNCFNDRYCQEICTNGIDDRDLDVLVDCNDSECFSNEYCIIKGLRAGLAAYWPMDGDFNDNSSNGHGGSTSLDYVPGLSGQAINFDGTSYVQVNNGNSFFNTQNFTVSVWINSNTTSSAGIMGRANKKFQIFVNSSGKVVVKDDVDYNFNSSSYQITLNSWHHIVVMAVGSTLKLYYDGVNVDTKTGYVNTGTNSIMRIGVDPDNTGNDVFYKYLDELTIWDRAISETEIAQLYNSGAGRSIAQ